MKFLYDTKPIIALSSSTLSNSAIAVIRISGFVELPSFQKVFKKNLTLVKPRHAYFTEIIDADSTSMVDEVTFVYFAAPASYNGENILEISCHGNQIIIQNIINLFINNFDIRLAFAGEFTYRAMVNNKLSLTQVEGLDLLLNANSPQILQAGQSSFKGKLHESFLELHNLLIQLKSSIDIALDFSEDIGDDLSRQIFLDSFTNFFHASELLFERTRNNNSALLNPSIVLSGQPNAGKSTLFNYLLTQERSIVSNIPGTTRDYVSESISIEQVLFRLIDTAGLRETTDKIEQVGIEHTKKQLSDSFFSLKVIHYCEFTNTFDPSKYDLVIVTNMDKCLCSSSFSFDIPNVLYLNLCGPMGPVLYGPMGPVDESGPIGPSLKTEIYKIILDKYKSYFINEPIIIDRQRFVIASLYNYLDEFKDDITICDDHGILSHHINKISLLCEELIGIITPDEILSSIFTNFCIGK